MSNEKKMKKVGTEEINFAAQHSSHNNKNYLRERACAREHRLKRVTVHDRNV